MGLSLTCVWLFQYRPFLANFDYDVDATYWIDLDKPRYRKYLALIKFRGFTTYPFVIVWAAMNVPIDLGIIAIPYVLIRKTKLKAHERRIIFMVFAAQALGTIARYFT